jgi:RNA polymerase sigma factor (sigma-70 family)
MIGGRVTDLAVSTAQVDFTASVERHERDLYVFLRGMVAHAEQARDLLQETFYDAWRAANRGTPPFQPGHPEVEMRRWLYHTAYCRAVSALRRRRLLRWESLDQAGVPEVDALPHTERFEERIAEQEALATALKELSTADAACLLLIVVHGFTVADAGRVLSASPQAVAKRLSRAKQRLLALYLAHNPGWEANHT